MARVTRIREGLPSRWVDDDHVSRTKETLDWLSQEDASRRSSRPRAPHCRKATTEPHVIPVVQIDEKVPQTGGGSPPSGPTGRGPWFLFWLRYAFRIRVSYKVKTSAADLSVARNFKVVFEFGPTEDRKVIGNESLTALGDELQKSGQIDPSQQV